MSDQTIGNTTETHLCNVVVTAIARKIDGIQSVDAFEKTNALASAAFTDLKAVDNVVERQGVVAGVVKTIDFAVGFG